MRRADRQAALYAEWRASVGRPMESPVPVRREHKSEPEPEFEPVEIGDRPYLRRPCAPPHWDIISYWTSRDLDPSCWECDVVPIDDPCVGHADPHYEVLVSGRVCAVHLSHKERYLMMSAKVRQDSEGRWWCNRRQARRYLAPLCKRYWHNGTLRRVTYDLL